MVEKNLNTIKAFILRRQKLLLVLPWLIYALYLVLMAAPQYESQSQLIVKSSDGTSSFDPSALMLSSVASSGLSNDSDLVEAFMLSSDMLTYLDQELNLREHYRSDEADLFSALSPFATKEDFLQYYLSHIDVTVDSTSSVITVKTRGFTPEYAQKINQAMVSRAEAFINEINNDLAKSKLTFARQEHQIVEEKLQATKTELLQFQAKYNVLDPMAEGAAFQQIAFSLEATLAQKKAELNTLSTMMSGNAPEMQNIKRQISAIQRQIQEQKQKLSDKDGRAGDLSVSELMAQYSNMKVELELAIQAYSASLVSLENTRVETYEKLQHLVTVERPTLPEDNQYPEIIYNLALFGVILLLFYGIARIVVATIREL
ncbi:capsule biosynthesis protein [Alteromonas halophila]|uniref:Capsule biosynthesis protein n=1 Tax=Alteromonas halophila TaxID=516698 RepID=A0A918JD39_9ALTE|nr:capsule biosynthesis protein [Alteromonas halophila]GGW72801.1 hypothetical protein GCM10007391_00370 [Alteromonas halophila]